MNWRNVIQLIRVEMKSGRLIRGQRLTKYRESRWFTYLEYGGALAIGLAVGAIAGYLYAPIASTDLKFNSMVILAMQNLLISLPTLILIYSIVLTMLRQIQLSGAKLSTQVQYWLPVTWQEHTLASVLAHILGFPLVSIIFIGSAVTLFSVFTGQVALAFSSVLAMCAAIFMASAITEILRILQSRFVGAVYKSTGRGAVWVRFAGSLVFFLVFYIFYFYIVSGSGAAVFVQTVASSQNKISFVPFVWPALTLYSFMNGLILSGFAYLVLSILLMLGLFYLAVYLNRIYGLYEPPAITVSRGVYAPKTGFLGKIGFSTVEAAIIRKDLKAFTRRRELIVIFILPIVFILSPLFQVLGNPSATSSPITFAIIMILPASVMATFLGSFITGEEGQAMWRIYSSPVSARNFVRSKYFLVILFSIFILIITSIVGTVLLHPSLKAIFVTMVESLLLAFTLGSLSLSNGIKGADFVETPRPKMIHGTWNAINLITCLITALAMLTPFLPYFFSTFFPSLTGPLSNLYLELLISGIIAVVLTPIFYRLAFMSARDLLRKAET